MTTERETSNLEYKFYDSTKRVKLVLFDGTSTPSDAVRELKQMWELGNFEYDTPLVQLRVVLPNDSDEVLISSAAKFIGSDDQKEAGIIGKIPFRVGQNEYGIYYLQVQSTNRKAYISPHHLVHNEAVRIGLEKRKSFIFRGIPDGFSVGVLDFSSGSCVDLLTGNSLSMDINQAAAKISALHKIAFEYAHDPAQQTLEGALDILANNPTAVAMDLEGEIVSVGYLEKDSRFAFGGITLVEPTYFTHPGEQYRKKGLSSLLRQATRTLVDNSEKVLAYKGSPMIVFNESIRHSSFPLCLENGCNLGGTEDLSISGNLGEAYTAIGPANPEAGYMPLGLTYFIDPRITVK